MRNEEIRKQLINQADTPTKFYHVALLYLDDFKESEEKVLGDLLIAKGLMERTEELYKEFEASAETDEEKEDLLVYRKELAHGYGRLAKLLGDSGLRERDITRQRVERKVAIYNPATNQVAVIIAEYVGKFKHRKPKEPGMTLSKA